MTSSRLMPLLIEVGTPREQRLLRAARQEGPSSRFRQEVLLSVGIASAVVTGSSTGTAATLGNAASVGKAAFGFGSSGFGIFVKWVGIAGLAMAAGTGAGLAAGNAWAEKTSASVAAAPARTAQAAALAAVSIPPPLDSDLDSESRAAPPAIATLPLPPPRVPAATSIVSQQSAASPESQTIGAARDASAHGSAMSGTSINGFTTNGRSANGSAASSVSEEVRLIDESRIALRVGDAARCLRLLSERRRRFPHGALTPEADLLRIEALSQSGQDETMKAEAARFLAQNPSGPLAARVRNLAGESD